LEIYIWAVCAADGVG